MPQDREDQRDGRSDGPGGADSAATGLLRAKKTDSPTRYVELLLDGEPSKLADKLADAGRTAGPWTTWRSAPQPLNEGRLPQRLIRQDNFLEDVTAFYDTHCRTQAA